MIITRSPLRISLGGGGTDLPSYYKKHSGFLIAAAIDKYVYITLHQTFGQELILKYSKLERVSNVQEIQHPIIREALKLVGIDGHMEITSMADIPAGTGLGSSGSFTTALLKALHAYKKNIIHPRDLAEQACHIELDLLNEPIGKQDQYIASYGGLTCFQFLPNGQVEATPLKIDSETLYNLEDNLLLFFTGYSRSASNILKDQDEKSRQSNKEMIDNLHFVKDLGYQSQEALEIGDLHKFGELMNTHWEHKKKRSGGMSKPEIDQWYSLAMENGALGGKLIGAGGGGFLMFYADDKAKLRHAMVQAGLKEVRFRFDFEGTKVIIQQVPANSIRELNISDVPAAILAGGLATRLRPFTEKIPKALVELAGRPFIDHQLDLLRRNGIRRVVFCLGYLGEMVEQHCGDGSKLGMELQYAYDGEKLLGTGGALRQASHLLGDVFWVMYGDSYMDIDYANVLKRFSKSDALGLMTVLKNANQWDRSNVVFQDGVLKRYDKKKQSPDMHYIDYGVALLRRAALERIPENEPFDLATLYRDLVAEKRMIGYEVTNRFYEIGTPAALEEARAYLASVSQRQFRGNT